MPDIPMLEYGNSHRIFPPTISNRAPYRLGTTAPGRLCQLVYQNRLSAFPGYAAIWKCGVSVSCGSLGPSQYQIQWRQIFEAVRSHIKAKVFYLNSFSSSHPASIRN
jgi:hypothetical protein